jgi:hypothetical protein
MFYKTGLIRYPEPLVGTGDSNPPGYHKWVESLELASVPSDFITLRAWVASQVP